MREKSHLTDPTEVMASELDRLQVLDASGNGSRVKGPEDIGLRPISFLEIVQLIWAQRRLVLRWTGAALAVFTFGAFLWPKTYTATTRLMPPDYGSNSAMALALPALSSSSSTGNSGGSVMGLASQLLGLNNSGDLFEGVLQSQTVEDRIIDRFDLMKVYSVRYRQDMREKLAARTVVKSDPKTGIIAISVADNHRDRAAAIANAYVEELDRVLAEVNTSSAHRERVFIEGRLKEVKQELDGAAKELASFSSRNAAFDVPEQAKAMVAAAADLQAQLINAQSELKGLQQIYTQNNVRVRSAQARLSELQLQVDKFGGKDVDPTKDPSLSKGELYPSVRQLPLLGVKYLDLYRRTKIDEAVFELLTREYEVAKVQEAREIPSVQVLDVAAVPEKKSSPHRLWIMLAGMFLGFVCSCARLLSPVLWERTDDRDPWKLLARDVFVTIRTRLDKIPLLRKLRVGFHRIFSWRPLTGDRTSA